MSVSTVINEKNLSRYTVSSYNLKVLKCNLPDLEPVKSGVVHQNFKNLDDLDKLSLDAKKRPPFKEELSESENLEPVANPSQDALIESLLKKADDVSDKYLKAQMELEDFKERTAANETSIRESAFLEGYNKAKEEASVEAEKVQSAVLTQLQRSIETLNGESAQFATALQSVKEELVSAALAIAKEVIVKELHEHSTKIALELAASLVKEIDNKSDITLKVHPGQLQSFRQALIESERIHIVADPAVTEGGVIVLSQMGTIEADIMQRFEYIKRNTLNK